MHACMRQYVRMYIHTYIHTSWTHTFPCNTCTRNPCLIQVSPFFGYLMEEIWLLRWPAAAVACLRLSCHCLILFCFGSS